MDRLLGAGPGLVPGCPAWVDAGRLWESWARRIAALPFDALRAQYASAVRSGTLPASMLDAGRFERGVAGWEHLLLGPWARER